MNKWTLIAILSLACICLGMKDSAVKIARLKYAGGGDWYANPSSLPNLISFTNNVLGTQINTSDETVEVGSDQLYQYPFIHMTGHGNVLLNDQEAENLRTYLLGGGFLHIDDNYGMDPFVRLMIKQVFPGKELVELPHSHPIYHQKYDFNSGLPKIHKHDEKAARGFAIMEKDRVLLFYSFESDLGDGWEDPSVHNDPEEIRLKALQMGCNLIEYAFTAN